MKQKTKWLVGLCAGVLFIGSGAMYDGTVADSVEKTNLGPDLNSQTPYKSVHQRDAEAHPGYISAPQVHGVPGSYVVLKGTDPHVEFLHPKQELKGGQANVVVLGLDAARAGAKTAVVEQGVAKAKGAQKKVQSGLTLFGATSFEPLKQKENRSALVRQLKGVPASYGTDGLVLDIEGVGELYKAELQSLISELAGETAFTLVVPVWEYDQYLKDLDVPSNVTVLGVKGYNYVAPEGVVPNAQPQYGM
jgi:hypothetical protein